MAQMFSSGVTPDYLQTLADAYAQYFPQQAPVNTQALQQWYSPSGSSPQGGSSAFAAPMGMEAGGASPGVVGSLFGEQFPQVRQGGSDSRRPMSAQQQAFFDNETPEARDARMQGVQNFMSQLAPLVPGYGLFNSLQKMFNPYGRAPTLSDTNLAAAISGQDAANMRDSISEGTRGGGYSGGGVATGGYGGDASGGGDRGTRGGF